MMPTMQEIDEYEEAIRKVLLLEYPGLSIKLSYLAKAARRGVEADAKLAEYKRTVPHAQFVKQTIERAEKAEAELAAFKEGLPATEDQNARFAIEGCIEYGRQGVNPPPDDHWLAPFWNMGRQLSDLAALKVERDEAVRREREAISKMASDLEEGQSVTTKLVLRLLTDRIRARKGEHDEQH